VRRGSRIAFRIRESTKGISRLLPRFIDEPVTLPGHCLDVTARRAEFRPQSSDVHIHGPLLDGCVITPDFFEETVSQKEMVLVGDEMPKKITLASSQANMPAIRHEGHRFEVSEQMGTAIETGRAYSMSDDAP